MLRNIRTACREKLEAFRDRLAADCRQVEEEHTAAAHSDRSFGVPGDRIDVSLENATEETRHDDGRV